MKLPSDEVPIRSELPRPIGDFDPLVVPIQQQYVQKFESWFCQTEKDIQLFHKLMQNIRMIDQDDFRKGIEYMRMAIMDFTDGEDYYLVVDDPGKSGDFILENLYPLDKPPKGVIRFCDVKTGKVSQIERGTKLVVADDALYSGERVALPLQGLLSEYGVPVEDVLVASVVMTNGAVGRLHRLGLQDNRVVYKYTVPVLAEVLTPEEVQRYKEKYDKECFSTFPGSQGPSLESYQTRVLTFFYYKVPDNFLPGLRRTMAVLRTVSENGPFDETYIIDDTEEGVYPPYRNVRSISGVDRS